MASANSERQNILLRPLFSRPLSEALSPVDKPRQVTLPTQLAHHKKSATYNSRIEKHHTNSRKRGGRASPDLDQQFADGIEDTRKEIREAADEVLSQVGADVSKELAQVVEEFEEKLQLALEYETRAFQSIADERLLITTLSPKTKAVKKREVVFGERMQDFRQIVEEEEAVIESLWRQWEEIQIETVCLAFEVLGSNGVILKEEDGSVIAPEKIDGAIQCYTQHQDALRNTLDKMTAMEGSAKNVTSQTIKALRAQQKELSAASKTTMAAMVKALQELNA